jgi:hypothetical protein
MPEFASSSGWRLGVLGATLVLTACAYQSTADRGGPRASAPSACSGYCPEILRPCGPDPGVLDPPSCIPPEARGHVVLSDESRHLRVFEACEQRRYVDGVERTIALKNVVLVEHTGGRAPTAESISALWKGMDSKPFSRSANLFQGMGAMTCNLGPGKSPFPCIEVRYADLGLELEPLVAKLGEALRGANDDCVPVRVEAGVPRSVLQGG